MNNDATSDSEAIDTPNKPKTSFPNLVSQMIRRFEKIDSDERAKLSKILFDMYGTK